MRTIERSALVTYTPQQMYDLVNDIERYPEFMEGCVGAEILVRDDRLLEARLDLQKGKLSQSFITRNTLTPGERIDMTLVDGPFERLEGYWQFQPLGNVGCKVQLVLHFQFKSKLLAMAANSWFEGMGSRQVDAVCQRAAKLYG